MTDAPKPHDAADLVERLRESTLSCRYGWWSRLASEAADAIERLAADNARLTRERNDARFAARQMTARNIAERDRAEIEQGDA